MRELDDFMLSEIDQNYLTTCMGRIDILHMQHLSLFGTSLLNGPLEITANLASPSFYRGVLAIFVKRRQMRKIITRRIENRKYVTKKATEEFDY